MNTNIPNCGALSEDAENKQDLREISSQKELWDFAKSWLKKFRNTEEANFSEKFIYLWVTVNAWASISVNNDKRNHLDSYLVKRMAASARLNERFEILIKNNAEFKKNVHDLTEKGPIFQVLWMRNNGIGEWNRKFEEREKFIERIREKGPDKFLNYERKYNQFAPLCAYHHMDLDEKIPIDWPHTLSMIYKIRCNLFHGGKNYSNNRDKTFITLAYSILWEVWKPEVPAGIIRKIDKYISWDRALVRSGFMFSKGGKKFNLGTELISNKEYFIKILKIIGMEKSFESPIFSPENAKINEKTWLNAIEEAHSGSEGGRPDDLIILDTYLAGLIRWINEIGIKTSHSCDGHGNRHPTIDLNNRQDAYLLDICLSTVSKGKIRLIGRRIENRRLYDRRRIQNNFDRKWLLDVAEDIYINQNELRNVVQIAKDLE